MNKTLTQPKKNRFIYGVVSVQRTEKHKQLNTKNILVLIIAFTIYFQVVNWDPYWTKVSDTDTQYGISSQRCIRDDNIFTKSAPSLLVAMSVCVFACTSHFVHSIQIAVQQSTTVSLTGWPMSVNKSTKIRNCELCVL